MPDIKFLMTSVFDVYPGKDPSALQKTGVRYRNQTLASEEQTR